ncbi:g7076 [Coccomyxa viridis]|uniref:G7076 protein n=1 Tax=Coccomyxa viridis TaxID=1274662 RepID=A0ABP1FWX2_9CHLO
MRRRTDDTECERPQGASLAQSRRATSLEQGKTRPSDTLDYETGDVWYFGPNIGHAILGLEPSGCTYLAVYDNGTFDEYASSFDLSTWISILPTPILSQGPPSIQEASQPSLPVQTAKETHRYPLKSSSLPQVDVVGGGSVTYVDDTLFPTGKNIWGGILHLIPNALRVSHWHLNADELQFIANGTDIEIGNFLEDGTLAVNTYQAGDVGLSPQGAAHYLKNNGNMPADILVVFNADVNTGIDLSWTLGSFPNSWIAATLNTTTNFTSALAKSYKTLTSDVVPASLAVPPSQ